jgi:hypothetical protein
MLDDHVVDARHQPHHRSHGGGERQQDREVG